MTLLQGDGVAALSTRAGLRYYFADLHGHRTVPVEIWQPVTLCTKNRGSSTQGPPDAAKVGQGSSCKVGTAETGRELEERLMTLREFTTRHLLGDRESPDASGGAQDTGTGADDGGTVAYLAQHALFDQIPTLWELVRVFPWVNVSAAAASEKSSNSSASALLHANVWLGEGGTITGLHFDSYDNFLLQLHGYKCA